MGNLLSSHPFCSAAEERHFPPTLTTRKIYQLLPTLRGRKGYLMLPGVLPGMQHLRSLRCAALSSERTDTCALKLNLMLPRSMALSDSSSPKQMVPPQMLGPGRPYSGLALACKFLFWYIQVYRCNPAEVCPLLQSSQEGSCLCL